MYFHPAWDKPVRNNGTLYFASLKSELIVFLQEIVKRNELIGNLASFYNIINSRCPVQEVNKNQVTSICLMYNGN